MKNIKKTAVSIAIILLAAVLIYYGISRGEVEVVLQKATKLCLECVGIG